MTSIGLFTYSTKPRGSVVHATYLAEALTARGHDVTLYALSKAGDLLYREVACPVAYLAAEKARADPDSLIAQRVHEISAGIARLRPRHDVYHAEDCLVASGLLASRDELRGAPLVRTLHHVEEFESHYLRDCQRRSIVEADAVACVSKVSQRDVERAFGRHCPIIGNGVDVSRFVPPVPIRPRVRRYSCSCVIRRRLPIFFIHLSVSFSIGFSCDFSFGAFHTPNAYAHLFRSFGLRN